MRPGLIAALVGVWFLAACSGGGVSSPYTIISPSSRSVVVLPGEAVRFEIRPNGGRTVEYVIDEIHMEPGPVFVLQPTSQHHVVRALIRAAEPTATPEVVVFTVDVEAPGNLPPQISSFTLEPETGSAGTTEFSARVTATDADGTIESLSIDFGDGTDPATGASSPFTATHVYAAPGMYTLTARAVDDAGVPVTTTRQVDVAPHNDPPTGSLHSALLSGGPPQGTGPLMVQLVAQGSDPDGSIATWELDRDLGDGFELIGPGETVTVTYPFREDPYMPVLRLTDNLGLSTEIQVDQEIVVLRDVSPLNSSYTVVGNPRFDGTGIAPGVWATGSDPLRFTIEVRDSEGAPVAGIRVRVGVSRPSLVAPDGTPLGSTVGIEPSNILVSDQTGAVTGSIVTDTSTRVEAMPFVGFQPFGLQIEVDLGREVWMPLDLESIPLNANSTVSGPGGSVTLDPLLSCPGDEIEIRVIAARQGDSPGGNGPAAGKFTALFFTDEQPLPDYRPAAGYGNWRTDGTGTIRFRYTPVRADQSRLFIAWVDGQPLDDLGTIFLRPPGECGGI
ncbi:MAG TPA: PKD domain-containing protein [Gemmatimonadota bacterium]|nr:PKD domain-containing protein [Gemmatimonadota bacterium]